MTQKKKQTSAARVQKAVALRAGTLGELTSLFASTGRWWLIPMVAVLVLSALVLGVVQVVEYAAPFVYTVF